MPEFKNGDIVWLKSGSPKMTIRECRNDGNVLCTWFDGNKKCTAVFSSDELTPQDPNPPLMPRMG